MTTTTEVTAAWEARFRVPRTLWARVARQDPGRGLVASSLTGTYQLHRWDVASGNLEVLTTAATGRTEGWLSPDGLWVVWHEDTAGDERGRFVAVPWGGGTPTVLGAEHPEGFSFAAGFSPAGTRFAAPLLAGGAWRLLAVDWSADGPGAARLLEAGAGFVPAIAVDDPGTIAWTTTGEAGRLTTSVTIIAGDGARIREIAHDGASVASVVFAPDRSGRLLASTTASGRMRPLVVDGDGTEHAFDLPDVEGDLQPTAWSRDGCRVMLLGSDRSTTRLSVLDVATGAWRGIPHPAGAVAIGSGPVDAASWLADAAILTTLEDGTHAPDAVAIDEESGAIARVLIPAADGPLSRPWRSVDIPTTDGAMVQGWLATPEGAAPFPTILDVHGGPEDQENDRYFPVAQAWLDDGFAFFTLNYRGSRGFGRDFEQAIWGDPGRRELDDMVSARQWLVDAGIADPAEVVPSGGSYGGYLTLLALTNRPELWAAGVALVGIADWTLMWEDGEALREFQAALFDGGPDDRRELYERASPITRVDALRAPLLIIQGLNDPRCPPRQMQAFVERAQSLGKVLEVDWFDAGHGHGGAAQRIAWQRRSMAFVEGVLRP